MQCSSPITLTKNLDPIQYPDGIQVPCGKCLGCRIKKRTEWTTRNYHERSSWSDSMFLTLTYSEEHIPYSEKTGYTTLKKTDLQKFFKRLRKNYNNPIKYFACGEYGGESERAHYHAIIFGLSNLKKEHRDVVKYSWPFCDWNNNIIAGNSFGDCTAHSIRYVAKYIEKLYSGQKAEEEYKEKDREATFSLKSQGLGLKYALENSQQLHTNKYTTINGVPVSLPRYYINKLQIDIDEVKENRIFKEREIIKMYTDLELSYAEAYKSLDAMEMLMLDADIRRARHQSNKNLEASVHLKDRSLKTPVF